MRRATTPYPVIHLTRGRGTVEVRAGTSFSHAEPTRGDSAPAAPHSAVTVCSAPGHRLSALRQPAGTRTPQRAPHRTPSSLQRQISARRGFSSLSVHAPAPHLAFPQVHLPSPPTWPRQRPTTARPPPPTQSPLHVSTRAASPRPTTLPTDCDRPQTTCPFSTTPPLPHAPAIGLFLPDRWATLRPVPACHWRQILWAPAESGGEV